MIQQITQLFDTAVFFATVGAARSITHYRKRQVIFSQGDQSDTLFYLHKGRVKLTLVSKKGKEAIVRVSSPGSFFGESCIASDHPVRFHSAVALMDVQVVKIPCALIVRMLHRGGDVSLAFIALILRHNAEILDDLANRLVDSSEETIARVISSLTQVGENRKNERFPKLSQQTIAEMMGITRQRVNVLMKHPSEVALARALKRLGR